MNFIKKFLKFLNPAPPVGGLAITDTSIKFLLIKDNNELTQASLRLPPGMIEGGRIKDKKNFVAALKNIHAQILPTGKPIHVVLNLPAIDVYTQSFTIPLVSDERLEEAARLNLQMISPINFGLAYAGWQKIGESLREGGQLELLGAFTQREITLEFSRALAKADFNVSAVEFPGLAISRLISEENGFEISKSYLLIDISHEGMSLMILKNLNLYYNHFHSWSFVKEEVGGKDISSADFQNFLSRELQKLINFYSSKQGVIDEAILTSVQLKNELTKILAEDFSLKAGDLSVKGFPGVDASWFPTLSSALRGLIPRAGDDFISLTDTTVKIRYLENRILNFIGLWRKIGLTVLLFILAVFLATDFFIIRHEVNLETEVAGVRESKEVVELLELEGRAGEFNSLVELAFQAKELSSEWSGFFSRVNELAGNELILNKISVGSSRVTINGTASNDAAVLRFKDRLSAEKNFTDVSLPLANIKTNPDETVNFSLSFRLSSLKF